MQGSKSSIRFGPITAVIYFAIWAISLIILWCSPITGNEMGYYALFFFLLLPLSSLMLSYKIEMNGSLGRVKWFFPLFFGIMLLLAEYLSFGLEYMLAQERFRTPRWELFAIGAALSALGLVIGILVKRIIRRIKCQNKE